MTEAVGMLRQFQDFDFFTEISDVVNRLQDQLAVSKSQRAPIVDFEVLLNPEFYAQILSFGAGVRLLSPANAVNFMRQTTRSMSEMYGH